MSVGIRGNASGSSPAGRARQRQGIVAGSLGNLVEWLDWTIYATMAPFFAALIFPSDSAVASLLASYAVFALSFALRPLGGILITPLGDRYGRKTILTATVVGMALGTLIIGLTPTYAQIGVWAPIIVFAARGLQGLAAGGEWGTASSFLLEHGGRDRRGFAGSFITWGAVVGVLLATVCALLVARVNASFPESAGWAWRVPFILGGLLGLVALYVRSRAHEGEEFEAAREASPAAPKPPMMRVFAEHWTAVLRVFIMCGAFQLGIYMFGIALPGYANLTTTSPPMTSLAIHSVLLVLFAVALPVVGSFSDRPAVGRKPLLLASATAMVVLPVPLLVLMNGRGPVVFAVVATLALLGIVGMCALAGSIFAEQFPVEVRATGIGLPVALATALFGGTAPFISTALGPKGIEGAVLLGLWISVVHLACLVVVLRMKETSPTKLAA